MIQALVFDFDGTIVDSDPIKRSAFYDVTAEVPGAAKVLDDIFAAANPGDRTDIFAALAAQLEMDFASDWIKAYGELCQSRILELLVHSDAGQSLARLKTGGYRLFVASATPQDDLVLLVEKSSLTTLFAGIYGRPAAKADILRDIMRSHDWTPREIAMIGNGESDRQAAQEVGCRFIGVISGGEDIFRRRPEVCLHKLDEMPDIVAQLNALMLTCAYP